MGVLRRVKGAPLTSADHDKNVLGRGGYADVATMLANTTETYSFWSAGDRFMAGGYLYEVLAEGLGLDSETTVSANHYLTTAGGLKVRPVSVIGAHDAVAWGVLPDGSDQTARFKHMLMYARSEARAFVVEIPAAVTAYRLKQVVFQDYDHDITMPSPSKSSPATCGPVRLLGAALCFGQVMRISSTHR